MWRVLFDRLRQTDVAVQMVSVLLVFSLVGTGTYIATSSAVYAQTVPAPCKPVGTEDCSSQVISPWLYQAEACSSPSFRLNEPAAFADRDIVACYVETWQGWPTLAAPKTSLTDFVLDCPIPNVPLQYPGMYLGVELQNNALYDIDPSACGTNPPFVQGYVQRDRELFCSAGYTLNMGGAYCEPRAVTANRDQGKNLGPVCDGSADCLVEDAVNYGTGNRFEVELDYAGAGPNALRFERFYNSAMRSVSAQNSHYNYVTFHNNLLDASSQPEGRKYFSEISLNPENHPATRATALDVMGVKWRHTYSRSVNVVVTDQITSAFVMRETGKVLTFIKSAGSWYAQDDINLVLADTAVGFQVTLENGFIEQYDSSGLLISISDRSGITQTLTYDGYGRLTAVADHFGRVMTFEYEVEYSPSVQWYDSGVRNQIKKMTDPAGGVYVYGYDTERRLVSVTYPDNTVRQYLYNMSGNYAALTEILYENGGSILYSYDSFGRASFSMLSGIYEVENISYSQTGSAPDLITSATISDYQGASKTVSIAVQQMVARVTQETNPCATCGGVARTFSYDANGNMISRTDYNGIETRYVFDQARNLQTSRTEAYGLPEARTVTTTWDPVHRLPDIITEPNRTTDFNYNANGNVTSRTVTAGTDSRTWTYTYNGDGQLLTEDGPRLPTDVIDVTTLTYYNCSTGSECGQPATVTNAVGHVTTFDSYDAHGRLLQATDPNGLVTSFAYDQRGRVTSITEGSRVTTLGYDNAGLLISITAPNSASLILAYNGAQLLTSVTDNLGNKIEYGYDSNGNMASENFKDNIGALKRSLSRTYDALDQVKTINLGGSITTLSFDGENNHTSIIDPNNNPSTTFDFDPLNRLEQVVDASAGASSNYFDANGNRTGAQAANQTGSDMTDYQYDGFDNLLREISKDRGETLYGYDEAGNLTCKADANAINGGTFANCDAVPGRSVYTYDAVNRVINIDFLATTFSPDVEYQYDLAPNQRGRLGLISHESGTGQLVDSYFAYNLHGEVMSHNQILIDGLSVRSETTLYQYDAAGQTSQITYPSGRIVDYVRDSMGRISEIKSTSPITGLQTTLVSNVTYMPFGPLKRMSYDNGMEQIHNYDTAYRISNAVISDLAGQNIVEDRYYTYDSAGNTLAIIAYADPALSRTYDYDMRSWLNYDENVDNDPLTPTYDVDANGNRIERYASQPGYGNQSFTFVAGSNRIATFNGQAVTYDEAGNTLNNGAGMSFTHNPANRLGTMSQNGGSTITNLYNGSGELARTYTQAACSCGNCPSWYEYFQFATDGRALGLVQENNGRVEWDWIWLDGAPIAQIQEQFMSDGTHIGTQITYLHPDHLNTPRYGTDQNGGDAWRFASDAYGIATTSGTATVRLRFPGQIDYGLGGIYYNYFRDYDSNTGRYLESDPIGLEGGRNTYGYAASNPMLFTDKFGLSNIRNGAWRTRGMLPLKGAAAAIVAAAGDQGATPSSDIIGDLFPPGSYPDSVAECVSAYAETCGGAGNSCFDGGALGCIVDPGSLPPGYSKGDFSPDKNVPIVDPYRPPPNPPVDCEECHK